jgi:hypothetical protein
MVSVSEVCSSRKICLIQFGTCPVLLQTAVGVDFLKENWHAFILPTTIRFTANLLVLTSDPKHYHALNCDLSRIWATDVTTSCRHSTENDSFPRALLCFMLYKFRARSILSVILQDSRKAVQQLLYKDQSVNVV